MIDDDKAHLKSIAMLAESRISLFAAADLHVRRSVALYGDHYLPVIMSVTQLRRCWLWYALGMRPGSIASPRVLSTALAHAAFGLDTTIPATGTEQWRYYFYRT